VQGIEISEVAFYMLDLRNALPIWRIVRAPTRQGFEVEVLTVNINSVFDDDPADLIE